MGFVDGEVERCYTGKIDHSLGTAALAWLAANSFFMDCPTQVSGRCCCGHFRACRLCLRIALPGRILLFRHTYRSEYPWGLPGGWLKRGEHAHEAIEREILEESGYQVHALRSVVIGGDRKLHRLDLYFECELINGTFQSSAEVCDAAFFELDHLPDCIEPFYRQVITYTACHPERSICRDEKT